MSYGPKPKYPLRDMQAGEARVIENPPRTFARYVFKKGVDYGMKFRTRQVEGGRLVRRIA